MIYRFPGDGGRFKEEEFTVSPVMVGGLKRKGSIYRFPGDDRRFKEKGFTVSP
jgi:hypothetical protein